MLVGALVKPCATEEQNYVLIVMYNFIFCTSIKLPFCQYSYYCTIEYIAAVFIVLSFEIRDVPPHNSTLKTELHLTYE